MQVCFFAISGVLPRDEAIDAIKHSIEKTYGRKGEEVVAANLAAVDATLANLYEVPVPDAVTSTMPLLLPVPAVAPEFVQQVTGMMIARRGDDLPVSALPIDGTYPTGTTQWEKRNLALEIPVWDPNICIQCGKCAMVCPHAVIRIKVADNGSARRRTGDAQDRRRPRYRIQGHGLHHSSCAGRLHRLRHLRGRVPGEEQVAVEPEGAQHGAAASELREQEERQLAVLPRTCRKWIAAASRCRASASSRCSSRCSNSPARAPAAVRLPTSSW